MAKFWLKLGVRRVVIAILLANLVGIPIIFMFHKPAALHVQSILDNFNSRLGMDTSTEIPQLVSTVLQSTGLQGLLVGWNFLKHCSFTNSDSKLTFFPKKMDGGNFNLLQNVFKPLCDYWWNLIEIWQSLWEHKRLGDLLKKASMPNKTVILTPLNHAWVAAGMIDIYFESFREGENIQELVNHIVIVAVDKLAYDNCTKIHPHCFMLRTNGVDFSGEKVYMTDDYLKMTWRKIKFLQNVLEMGYNFIFSVRQ